MSSITLRSIIALTLLCAAMVDTHPQTLSADSTGPDTTGLAQPRKECFLKRLDRKLATRYFSSKYDTSYVARPPQRWLFRLMTNQTGNYIYARGTVNDVYSKYKLHTMYNTTLSLEVNYCDIAASLSINPAKIAGKYNDYEFNFEYHGQQVSIDINYQRSTSLAGDIRYGDYDHLDKDGLRMKIFNIAGYYTFNNRRFSFPAALYQNYDQLLSAGSWLAGVSFQGGSIRTTEELKQRSPNVPDGHLTFSNIGIGAGYGYNFVLGKHSQWLIHISALPTFVVYKHNKLTINGQEKSDNRTSLNMIFNERAAITCHFSPRYFAGASFIMSNSLFDDTRVLVQQSKWMARAFIGLRL